jgi:L-lactate dehydrogenase
MCLIKITKAIFNDENLVLNVSSPVEDIYMSMPSVINKDGIKGTMKIDFNEEELVKYNNTKKIIKDAIDGMEE